MRKSSVIYYFLAFTAFLVDCCFLKFDGDGGGGVGGKSRPLPFSVVIVRHNGCPKGLVPEPEVDPRSAIQFDSSFFFCNFNQNKISKWFLCEKKKNPNVRLVVLIVICNFIVNQIERRVCRIYVNKLLIDFFKKSILNEKINYLRYMTYIIHFFRRFFIFFK